MEHIQLQTKDNVDIAGLWWDARGEKTALLFHMMPATKESWNELAERLFARGLNVLAVDFRGHGESGGGDYKTFTDEQHQQYILDAWTAVEFIRKRYPDATDDDSLVLAGASIGANIAIQLMVEEERFRRACVLSPGLNYRGVNAEEYVKRFSEGIYSPQILFVSSRDDKDNAEQTKRLSKFLGLGGELIIYETGGHGTDLFGSHSELLEKVAVSLAA